MGATTTYASPGSAVVGGGDSVAEEGHNNTKNWMMTALLPSCVSTYYLPG